MEKIYILQNAPHIKYKEITSAVIGGSYTSMLDENIEKYGAQSILLRIEPLSMDFTLPSRSSDGVTISPDKKRRIFYSNDLEINYYTYIREGKAHFVLFDSANSIRRKLAIAQSKNIDSIIIPPREMQKFGIDMR